MTGWIETDNLIDSDWASLDWLLNADAGYGTHWSTAETSTGYTTECYGLHVYTTTSATLYGEYLKARSYNIEFEFVPLWVAPY